MTNLKEMAKAYEPPQTHNICELEKVSIDIDIKEATYQDKDGQDFTILETEIKGQKYRVPKSVLKQLKVLLEKKPNMTHFTVGKSGEGLGTEYQVIPE